MKRNETFKNLISKHKETILYLFFGVCTCIINMMTYYVCYRICGISNVISTAIAWTLAVIAAYITNKVWVFACKSFEIDVLIREMVSFFSCRIATGFLEIVLMYIFVDCLYKNEMVWKLTTSAIVTILNYIFSKLLIFKRK